MFVSLESLSEPVPGDLPAGEDCVSEIQAQNLALMNEYLVERAIQKGRERAADQPALDDGEARNAAAVRDDGKRRLASLEGILKDVLKLGSVNVEQTGKALREKASALLAQRGKDLRLVPHLGVACTFTEGLDGYLAVLKLTSALLEAYPADLFPLPDEDDPTDMWQRVNAVTDLLAGAEIHAMLGPCVLLDAKQSGRLTFAELAGGLRGDMPVAEMAQPDLNRILSEAGPERVQQVFSTLREIEASIAFLVGAFTSGSIAAPRLAESVKRAAARIGAFVDGGAVAPIPSEPQRSGTSVIVAGNSVMAAGGLRSREDARRAIQDVIRFIETIEPGHPAPLLLHRADRLLGMGFIDIIKDMAPNALSDISLIVGVEPAD